MRPKLIILEKKKVKATFAKITRNSRFGSVGIVGSQEFEGGGRNSGNYVGIGRDWKGLDQPEFLTFR
jgi:hypothetical protein